MASPRKLAFEFKKMCFMFLKIEDNILGLGTFDKSCRPCWFDHFDISHVLVAYKTREVVQCTCFKNLYHDTVPQLYHDTVTLKRL